MTDWPGQVCRYYKVISGHILQLLAEVVHLIRVLHRCDGNIFRRVHDHSKLVKVDPVPDVLRLVVFQSVLIIGVHQ